MPRALALPAVTFLLLVVGASAPALGLGSGASLDGVSDDPVPHSVRFVTDGGPLSVEVSGEGTGSAGAGFYLSGPAGAILVTVAKVANRDGVLVDARSALNVHFDMTATTQTYSGFGKGIAFESAPAGEYELIAFGAGDVARWAWSVHDPDARIMDEREGAGSTWLATSRDFVSGTNVQAFQSGAGARATDGTFAFRAKEGLVGVYYPVHATSVHDSLMAATPSGSRDCTCAWLANGPAGAYTLYESGVGAGQALLADVVFIGADATFA